MATDGNRFLTKRQQQLEPSGGARTQIMAGLRVLVLSPSLERSGGVQRYTMTLVKALRQILPSQDVRLVAVPQGGGGHSRLSFATKARFVRSAVRAAMSWRPALVICTHVGLAALGWAVRVLRRCPYWVVAHGVEVWGALPFPKRFGLRQADRVLCGSSFTSDQVTRRQQCSAEKVRMLHCAFSDDLLSVTPDQGLLARLGVGQGRVILTAGRLAARERYKGHDVVLQALKRIAEKCPEVKYLIVGDGDDRPRLEQLAHALGVEERVLFAGKIDDAGLAACYQACEVFVLPAKTRIADHGAQGEGFGIAFLEAMAFGKPVVGPNVGAPAEFIRHSEHGLLVDPESPEEVAQAVLTLLHNPELASRMGEQARISVLEEFCMGAMVQQVEHLLQECRW